MKSIIFSAFTVLVSLLVSLFAAEIILHLTWTPPSLLSTRQFEQHPIYSWAPRPGISGRHVTMEYDYTFSHTLQGLRGGKLFSTAPPVTSLKRILFLGDSFTYGIGSGDDEIFFERINNALPAVEAINTGANGYGQRQQLAILDTLGASLKPDLVIIMFFWNDIEDNLNEDMPSFSIDNDGNLIRTDISIPDDFDPLALRKLKTEEEARESWFRRTYLYKLFKEGIRGFRHSLFGVRERKIQTMNQKNIGWDKTYELLQMMQQRCREIGARMIIASIPDYELVSPDQGALKGQDMLNIAVETKLLELTAKLQIPYLDLLPELKTRQAGLSTPLYYHTDRHLTPAGNNEVAEILLPFIKTNLSPPVAQSSSASSPDR